MPQEQEQRIADLEREIAELRAEKQASVGWRRWLQWLLLGLGLLVLIPASLLLWLNRTVTTTDGYLRAVGPAIHEPAVQLAVQKASTDAVLQRVDVDQLVGQALPDNAQFLAAPIATQVKSYTFDAVGRVVSSPQFANLWVEVNRRAQQRFMDIARQSSGDPNVNISDLYKFVSAQLAGTRLAVLANRDLPPAIGNVQVANVPALERIPHFVASLSAWNWGALGLAVVLLGAAVLVAPDRRRALVWTGLGWIAATILTLALVRIARNAAVAQIADPVYRNGAAALWRSVLDPFFVQTLVLGLLGLALALLGWALGPGRVATRLRTRTEYNLGLIRSRTMPQAGQSGMVRFVRQYHTALQWGLLVATILALLLLVPLNVAKLVAVLLLAVLALLILEFLVAPEVSPSRRS